MRSIYSISVVVLVVLFARLNGYHWEEKGWGETQKA